MMSPYDKQVYDAGFKYVPRSEFLLNPFQIPQGGGGGATGPVQPGLPSINIGGGGGGGGFNPYNPDMSQIRTDFNPRAYNLAMRQGNTVGPNPDLFYAPQSKIGAAMDFVPGIGIIKRGAEFLKKIMPVNERAIMENEARGMGIFTDDIGRIVAGPGGYNTAQGIMAGYNLSGIDSGTFDKRRGTIENTLKNKYDLTAGQIEAAKNDPNYAGPGATLINRLGLLDEAEDLYLGPLKTRTDTIYKYRKDKKIKEKKKREEEKAAAAAAEAAAEIERRRKIATTPGRETGSGGREVATDAGAVAGAQQDITNYQDFGQVPLADGGRVYYMDGGLADLVDIYD